MTDIAGVLVWLSYVFTHVCLFESISQVFETAHKVEQI